MKILRQGDVVIRVVKQDGIALNKTHKLILAEGEVTGHNHELIPLNSTDSILVEERKGLDNPNKIESILFTVKGRTLLRHQEHDAILLDELPQGYVYERRISKEFNPFEKAWQQVRD